MNPTSINLRVSTLAHWTDCPRRGAANAFRELITDAGFHLNDRRHTVSAAIGTGVHAGAAHTLKEKREARKVKLKVAIEIGIEKYRSETADGVEYDDLSGNRNIAEKQVKIITEIFHNQVAPGIEPVEIECPMDGKIALDGLTILLIGHPDVMETDSIHDLKTSKNVKGYSAQLGGYKMLSKANKAGKHNRLIIDWIPRVPVSKPHPGALAIDMAPEICVNEANSVILSIKEQVSNFILLPVPMCFPANPCSNLCSERYCTAWGTDFCKVSKL